MNREEQTIIKREDRLLKNQRSWRRARIGAIFLFAIFLIAFLAIYRDDLMSRDERIESLTTLGIWCVFWIIIVDWLTLRIQHIDTINFYRQKYCATDNNEESQP